MSINNYENLKILKRMQSKTILFLYLFYIIFAQWVFIKKVGFDILLISASLTFLFTFAMGSMLQNELKNKDFFIELKELYKKYDKSYGKIDVSHINNTIENEETALSTAFFSFSIFIGVVIGVALSFSYGQKILPFFDEIVMLAISAIFLIFVFLSLFGKLKEELEEIKERQKGVSGFFKYIFLYGIIRPLFIAVEFIGALIVSGVMLIFIIIAICLIISIIFGGASKMFALIFVIIGNIITVCVFGLIFGAITFLIFQLMGFGVEKFSKKDIFFLEQGLEYEIDNLKKVHNICENSFAVNDTIKYILLFTIPFVAAYLWSYLTTDIGFSILSYIKPIKIHMTNILGLIPNWEMVTSAKGFGNTISSFFGFIILLIIGIIAIPFRAIAWVIQAIVIIFISIFNSLIGIVLIISFLFPILYASWIKFKENKSLSNITSIYIYLSFIIILFFLSLL